MFLLLSVTACDYTGPQGGTLDVNLSSTDSDLQKAVVTVEHISVDFTSGGHKPSDFGSGLNMIEENVRVDLASLEGSESTLLSRAQVLPAEFNQLHVTLSDTARIAYRDGKGTVRQEKVALSEESLGEVVLTFDKMRLMQKGETAKIEMGVNLDQTFEKTEGESTYRFKPDVAVEQVTVNGRKRE